MKFCSRCGGPVRFGIPDGDDRPRHICDACSRVFYENPRMVVGCLPRYQGRILLCRRSIEPRRGFWTLPAGFLENGETLEAGAVRETREEACAEVELIRLYSGFSLPRIHQVHFLFLSDLLDGAFAPGHETLEARLFSPEEIPWENLAFRTMQFTLERYVEEDDPEHGPVHLGSFDGDRESDWIRKGN